MYRPIQTANEFNQRIQFGHTTESIFIDYKRLLNIHVNGPFPPMETAKDICSFANLEGGSILVGVDEVQNQNGIGVAQQIVSVNNPDDVREWVETRVRRYIYPNALPFTTDIIMLNHNDTIVVINVPPITMGLAAFMDARHQNKIEYPIRTSHGNRSLTAMEVGMRQSDPNYNTYLVVADLFRVLNQVHGNMIPLVLASRIHPAAFKDGNLHIDEVTRNGFRIQWLAGTKRIVLPYAFVDAAWKTADNKFGLALKGHLIAHKQHGMEYRTREWSGVP